MKKGDIVEIKAYVEARYGWPQDTAIHIPEDATKEQQKKMQVRSLFRFSFEGFGVLVGKSYLATGISNQRPGNYLLDDFEDPPFLSEDKRHPVWVVEPHVDEDRYYLPIRCLASDLEKDG